ncbi:MAG: hypothetical protein ACLQU1_17510 [Bryobacteraceae bacterium]
MKTLLSMAIVAAATLGAASAQDKAATAGQDYQTVEERTVIKKMLSEAELLGAKGGFLGAEVKGAPYSGEEIAETTQVLADGTRIHNESHTMVYRDSDGRVRREIPEAVTIWDPVANASYFLNTKDQTFRQMPLAVQYLSASVSKDGTVNATVRVGDPKSAGALAGSGVMLAPPMPNPSAGGAQVFFVNRSTGHGQLEVETLGRQTMEGVAADGTRQVNTIETGAIGNDRPIQITSERWYSPELQTVVLTRHNDPRTGEEVFHLTNVSRSEPPANLFAVPAGYQRLENK